MKQYEPITVFRLKYACGLYRDFTHFDAALDKFRKSTQDISLQDEGYRTALLKWLNAWFCRQFKIEHHAIASQQLLDWGSKWLPCLPKDGVSLLDLSEAELTLAAQAYGDLSRRKAATRRRGERDVTVTFGPTGAAKVLYALRPEAFPPWDTAIRQELGYSGSPESYRLFLEHVTGRVQELINDARRFGVGAEDIPATVGREGASLVKLIDEYCWITITRGWELPGPEEVPG